MSERRKPSRRATPVWSASPVYESVFAKMFRPVAEEMFRPYRTAVLKPLTERVQWNVGSGTGVLAPAVVRAGDLFPQSLGAQSTEGFAAQVLGRDPFGLGGVLGRPGADVLEAAGIMAAFRSSGILAATTDAATRSPLFSSMLPPGGLTAFTGQSPWSGELFRVLDRPLAPRLPERAEDLAEHLFPPNLQGFTDREWTALIDMCGRDGIGVMWAPGGDLLRALLNLGERKDRYAYLIEHQNTVLDEIDASLEEISHTDLQDLTDLTRAAVTCARSGAWEGALALTGNILNTAMEHHGIAWYRTHFATVPQINGIHGPGAVLRHVDRHVSLPERTVGIFDLAAHLVRLSIHEVFADTLRTAITTQDTFNRHLAAHRSSCDSYRREFTLPALLGAHCLLRALNEAKLMESR
ncbi:hypothetical protein [Streptomyces sp. NPDC088757]|uniref:hypothetical protein n=1 Tax=Streptomyces sp. NPDC088757 TaxID=3365889 RepID=UPI003820B382